MGKLNIKNTDIEKFIDIAHKIGVEDAKQVKELFDKVKFTTLNIYDYLPDLVMMTRSFVSQEDFMIERQFADTSEPCLLLSFNNVFDDGLHSSETDDFHIIEEIPHIRIGPLNVFDQLTIEKSIHKKQLLVLITYRYLKEFLNDEEEPFLHLLDQENLFWIEEIMSEDIIRVIHEITSEKEIALAQFYFKLKALELVYFLFRDLSKRKDNNHKNLTANEIVTIYNVRDFLVKQLDKPATIADLLKIASMNELKLRKIFTQVFGMGIYDYYQQIRMKEAARLLKEESLNVSEVGFKLGFTNLSHFGKVFEEHIGMKPKKFAMSESN
ncbi:helix-turn-helix transcriptional regulator [Flavobacterium jejuense]|uniref:Helix-turn-helix transcriptional regulator n=1 Tax=Flavobacterium jejuense TaxID=1544455 RepID=A0ABX0INL3_9FLAO|nr:response regulator transcription factor [Flavobacterium jejuense]NHN25268.1 helix-turn-helix transcriptional regulator [Flavobacterium jejuense]